MTKIRDASIILESIYKLEKKIVSTDLEIKLENETHVPDLMTRIRILPSVAVVAQNEKVSRFYEGSALLDVSVKFLPKTTEIYASIKKICVMIKRLPGVKSITVNTYDKKLITMKGKKIVF